MLRSADTSPDMQKKYDELLKGLSPEDRFLKGMSFIAFCHSCLIAGFKAKFPELSEKDLKRTIIEQVYGDALTPNMRLQL